MTPAGAACPGLEAHLKRFSSARMGAGWQPGTPKASYNYGIYKPRMCQSEWNQYFPGEAYRRPRRLGPCARCARCAGAHKGLCYGFDSPSQPPVVCPLWLFSNHNNESPGREVHGLCPPLRRGD